MIFGVEARYFIRKDENYYIVSKINVGCGKGKKFIFTKLYYVSRGCIFKIKYKKWRLFSINKLL